MVGVAAAGETHDPRLGPPPPPGKTKLFVYGLTVMAVIGGFLFGYDTGVVAGAMIIIKEHWGRNEINDIWQELIVSVTVGAAAVFALLGGPINDRFGRKPTIMTASALFTVGAIIMGVADTKEVLLVGRIVVGGAIGLSSMCIPPYIAEACPPEVRGRLITMFQLFITFGFWVAGLLNGAFSYLPVSISWRFMLGAAGIPSLLQLIGFIFMPESPRWLATHGRQNQAMEVLNKVCSTPEIAKWELKAIEISHEDEEKQRLLKGGQQPLTVLLSSAEMRRALAVGCLLQMFQQLSGINTVMYYSTTIIQMAGIKDTHLSIWLTSVVSAFNFFCTFLGLYLVEKIGRRKLTIFSTAAVVTCLVLLGIGFVLIANDSPLPLAESELGSGDEPSFLEHCSWSSAGAYSAVDCDACSYMEDCGFCMQKNSSEGICMRADEIATIFSVNGSRCSEGVIPEDRLFAHGWCPSRFAALPILAMVVYLCAFSCGLGPMPWTINAEIYPHYVRSIGNSLATATNWLFNLLVSLTFLSLVKASSRQGAFFIYAGISLVGLIVFYFVVPETKNKNLEELQHLFSQPWFEKRKPHDIVYPSKDLPQEVFPRVPDVLQLQVKPGFIPGPTSTALEIESINLRV